MRQVFKIPNWLTLLPIIAGIAGMAHMSQAAPAKKAPPPPAASVTIGGSAERGAGLYVQRCGGCHSVDANRVGPAHRGVVGRKAGVAAGYAYSPALKAAPITFTEANLERWLINPQTTIPGTRMFFRLSSAQERADIIAYLKSQTSPR
jgi:cytochrome c